MQWLDDNNFTELFLNEGASVLCCWKKYREMRFACGSFHLLEMLGCGVLFFGLLDKFEGGNLGCCLESVNRDWTIVMACLYVVWIMDCIGKLGLQLYGFCIVY
ncbi:unnamed protein product [Lathyrus oleraceus]